MASVALSTEGISTLPPPAMAPPRPPPPFLSPPPTSRIHPSHKPRARSHPQLPITSHHSRTVSHRSTCLRPRSHRRPRSPRTGKSPSRRPTARLQRPALPPSSRRFSPRVSKRPSPSSPSSHKSSDAPTRLNASSPSSSRHRSPAHPMDPRPDRLRAHRPNHIFLKRRARPFSIPMPVQMPQSAPAMRRKRVCACSRSTGPTSIAFSLRWTRVPPTCVRGGPATLSRVADPSSPSATSPRKTPPSTSPPRCSSTTYRSHHFPPAPLACVLQAPPSHFRP